MRLDTQFTISGLVLALIGLGLPVRSQPPGSTRRPPSLGMEQGTMDLDTPDFTLRLVKASQTVAALLPKSAKDFDFTPGDRIAERASNGFYHLGDLTLRVRKSDAEPWVEYSTATDRKPVLPLNSGGSVLAAADLTPTLPADCPVKVVRSWKLEGGRLTLHFDISNTGTGRLQIGSLGIPMVFNNIISGRNLEQAHEICSFSDPYMGVDAGYLQVTRLSGHGPALVVTPSESTKTPFEGYQLLTEPMRPNQTFEGMFAWMVHTRAYADREWSKATPWNEPTEAALAPGASRSYGVKFLVAPEIRDIEKTLAANARPVAVGIPGYVLPMDLDAKLFLKYSRRVASITCTPSASIIVTEQKPTPGGWMAYVLRGKNWGRARLNVTYADGLKQTISCYVVKPASEVVADLGRFLFSKQWFVDTADPFRRSPSVMSYDREANQIVAQDSRVWIAGLGDEGGSGSWLAAAMKEFVQPGRSELTKYEQFVDNVLWGGIQYNDGPNKYGVRKSMFYYAPKELPEFVYDPSRNWTSWTSWNRQASEDIGRAYNYPHVVAAYWSLYRIARNSTGLVINHSWDWYLDQAYRTTKFLTDRDQNGNSRVGYVDTGLMEGDIFVAVLKDLKREGWTEKAAELERNMRIRAETWKKSQYPFGSEMAWDSTGQEEVFAWCKYFGYDDKAAIALNSVLGYMPTLPHWAYNGNARRYWDFLYGGKLSRIERQIHHYGSGINALPVLAQYRETPGDFYLLRVGYAGGMAALTNIDQEGFGSAAFHSFESTLKWDAYSGDYGPNFFGHAMTSATYVVNHPEYGWQAFGGNIKQQGAQLEITPLDSMRRRIYIAPMGLWLTLDAGTFASVRVNSITHAISIGLSASTPNCTGARLRIEQPAKLPGVGAYKPVAAYRTDAGAFTVTLKPSSVTWVALAAGK